MLSVCGVVPPLLLTPPHPAMPPATHTNKSAPTLAYPSRFAIGSRRRISKNAASNRLATIPIGPSGRLGVRGCGDPPGGASSDSAIVKVAVHDPGVVLVPAVGVHVA